MGETVTQGGFSPVPPKAHATMPDPAEGFKAPPRAADIYASARDNWTLGALESQLGYTTRGAEPMEADWLDALRAVPFAALDDDDLGALVAKGMHLPVLLPIALSRVRASQATRVPPSGALVEGCGEAARRIRSRAPDLSRETTTVLQSMLATPWSSRRVEVLEAVYSALS